MDCIFKLSRCHCSSPRCRGMRPFVSVAYPLTVSHATSRSCDFSLHFAPQNSYLFIRRSMSRLGSPTTWSPPLPSTHFWHVHVVGIFADFHRHTNGPQVHTDYCRPVAPVHICRPQSSSSRSHLTFSSEMRGLFTTPGLGLVGSRTYGPRSLSSRQPGRTVSEY